MNKEQIKELAIKWGKREIYPEMQSSWQDFCESRGYDEMVFQVVELMEAGNPITVYQKQSKNRLDNSFGKIPDYRGIEVLKKATQFSNNGKCSDLIMNLEPEYYAKNEKNVDSFEAMCKADKQYCEGCKKLQAMEKSSYRRVISSKMEFFDYNLERLKKEMARYKIGEKNSSQWKQLFDGVVGSVEIMLKYDRGESLKNVKNLAPMTIKMLAVCADPKIVSTLINNGTISETQRYEALKTKVTSTSQGAARA